ncbi:MAG: UvrD-helicase domain-containing protein, partial [Deltaproteobacteria bacterium]|nr:UvrD-helicase domain-containing protein [Deltaproteobacteria bacterium]
EPEDLYTEAARAVFQELEGSSPVSRALEALLFHLDNRAATLERMLCSMLTRRDQWLRHLSPDPKGDKDAGGLRQRLERARAGVIREGLAEACRELTDALKSTLPAGSGEGVEDSISLLAALMDHAATQAGGGEGAPELELLAGLQGLPPAEPEALPGWRALAGLLLTGTGDWRKKLSRAQGFPVKDSSGATPGGEAYLRRRKGEMEALLDTLRENLNPESLDAVRMLPDEKYTDGQWEILRALLVLLPRAVEHLGRAFAAAGQVDFIEVSRAALRALEGAGTAAGVTTGGSAGGTAGDTVGDAGGGTWGGLAAVGIRHLLLDEFQDTSTSQHELVTRLTRGWSSAGDNPPTLFLVGDPMQSIYGFREAEVGLFLQARSRGIGGLRLEPLTLRVNFRSRRPVVNWVNEHFPAVLAPRESVAEGAVTFTPSEAFRGAESGGVSIHPVLYNTGTQEPAGQEGPEGEDRRVRMARLVVRLAAEARRENPGGSVAVLVHARSHLTEIVPALRQAGISFQAVGIDPLASRPAVSDLLCLTRALLHPADRVAWLALLRGPLCGLLLSDLLRLCPAGEQGPEHLPLLNEALGDGALLEGISPDGRARLERVAGVLGEARQNRERRSLRRWVEGVWLALGGPAGLLPGEELQAKAFLDHLENTFGGGQLPSRAELEAGLEKLYAPPDVNADGRLLLMTIHQAKGLEFDTVILPALERRSRPDDPPLLIWHERPTGPSRNGGEDPGGLLLAPIGEKGGGEDSLYSYLKRLRRDKRSHEAGRLLYVGATRARERLHLLACCGVKDGALVNPSANSPLHRLWGAFGPAAWKLLEQGPGGADSAGPGRVASELTDTPSRGNLRRLPSGWSLPAAPAAVMAAQGEGFPSAEPEAEAGMPVIEFNWAGEVARHVGTLVHSLLQCAAQEGLERWTPGYARGLRESNRRALAALGTPEAQLEDALDRVGRA